MQLRSIAPRQREGSLIGVILLIAALLLVPTASRAMPLQGGDILVTSAAGTVRVDPTIGATSLFSSVGGTDIASGVGGVFVTSGNSVIHLDPANGIPNVISSGGLLQSLVALDVAPNGDLFVLSHAFEIGPFGSVASVITVNPRTGNQSLLAVVDTRGWGALDLAVGLNGILFVDTQLGFVLRVNISTGAVTNLGDLDHGRAIDILPNGDLVIAHNVRVGIHSPDSGFLIGQVPTSVADVAAGPDGQVYFSEFSPRGGVAIGHFVPFPGYGSFTEIAPGVTGRLTVFVPAASTLFLLALGLASLGGIGAWRRTPS